MAVIQKIRTKYAKLAGFVIALSLVGFLLMDAGDNLKKLFSGGDYVAKVNGEKITPMEYMIRINEYESLYELMGNRIDENTRAQIHTQVLNEMVYEKIVDGQLEDLGIVLTPEEEKDMIMGMNPDPLVIQFPYFRNPETNEFDPQILAQFEKKSIGDPNDPMVQKAFEQWENMKNYIKRQRLYRKYNALFSNGVHYPDFLTKQMMNEQSKIAGIQFVKIPYTTVNDNEVQLTDADIKDYIKKHAAQYRIEQPTRSIDYVAFDIIPSADDTAKVFNAIVNLREEFESTTDVESFVNRNSEESYAGDYVTKNTLMSMYAEQIFALQVGEVYGPYHEKNAYRLTKVLEKKNLPDSVKVRHILVRTEERRNPVRPDSIAKIRLDSAVAKIRSGANFAEVVSEYSDDQGSINMGGEYEFSLSQRAQISTEFADFIFEGKAGEKKIVKVSNDNYSGYHYIEILDQRNFEPACKLATISKTLAPGQATIDGAYAKAIEFAGKNNTAQKFDEAVQKEGLIKLKAENVKMNDFILPGIGSSREIIRWMYDAEKGAVSEVFPFDNRYIVAKLSAIREKGLMQPDESNRPMIESQIIAKKKAALIAERYKSVNSLEALSQLSGQPIMVADSFNAGSNFIPTLGFEPKVVGYAFNNNLKPSAISTPIPGSDGVFFITVVYRYDKPQEEVNPMMLQQQAGMQTMQLKNSIGGMLMEDMRRKANIQYDVHTLY
jgi:peptidyl-prolyl cis-trans isomerase D